MREKAKIFFGNKHFSKPCGNNILYMGNPPLYETVRRISSHRDDQVATQDGAHQKITVRFKSTFICISALSTKSQGRELLPQCQTGQAAQDALRRQGRARPGRENHPGRGISEGGGRDDAGKGSARSAVVWCVSHLSSLASSDMFDDFVVVCVFLFCR